MGIRLYLYEIAIDDWWQFIDDVNRLYLTDSPMAIVMTELNKTKQYGVMIKLLGNTQYQVDIQRFEYDGVYLFRVLEAGYFFMNNFQERFPYLKTHFYDNHSDIDEEMEREAKYVDIIDDTIKIRHYMIYPVIDETSFRMG